MQTKVAVRKAASNALPATGPGDVWDQAAVGLHWVAPDGKILWANQTELSMLGYTPEEYVGRNIREFHADRQRIESLLARLNRRETLRDEEAVMRCRDGTTKAVLIDSSAYVRGGQFLHTRCFTRDVTPQRRMEAQLRENEELLRLVTEASPALVAYVDSEGRYRFVNQQYETWFRRTRDNIVGRTIPEVLGAAAYARIEPYVREALEGRTVTFEMEVPYDAGTRNVRAMYVPHLDGAGRSQGYLSVVTDASDAVRRETEFTIYREMFRASVDGIAYIDPQGKYVAQNPAHLALLGYSDAEIHGKTPAIHLGQEKFVEIVQALEAHGRYRGEVRSRARDGRMLDIELSASTIWGPTGEVVGFVGIKRDISQRRKDERLLEQRLEHLQAIYEMSQTVGRAERLPEVLDSAMACLQRTLRTDRTSILLFDAQGVMRFRAQRGLSERYQRAVDGHSPWKPDESAPKPMLVQDVEEDEAWQGYRALFRSEDIRSLAFIPLMHQGRLLGKFMVYYREPHRFEAEEIQLAQTIAGHVAFAIHRKAAEDELRAAHDRLTELDRLKTQFINTVSHELRTPLTPIQLQLDVLAHTMDRSEAAQRSFAILSRNVERLAGLVNDMVDVSRIQSGHLDVRRSPVDLGEVLSEAVESYREPARRAEVVLEFAPVRDLVVDADAHRLGQVLSNLLSNAVKFTPRQGRVVVGATRVDGGVRVDVRDTGQGLTPQQIEQLFRPFSQVHPQSARSRAGTGLGLYICRNLIEAHDGRIWAESPGPGSGTTFAFWLPVRAAERAGRTSPA